MASPLGWRHSEDGPHPGHHAGDQQQPGPGRGARGVLAGGSLSGAWGSRCQVNSLEAPRLACLREAVGIT